MRLHKTLLAVALVGTLFTACSKSSETTENPGSGGGGNTTSPGSCDTVGMRYAANVQPILQANCYVCHGNGNVEGGISLDTYSKAKTLADNGKLIGVISHAAGFSPMPKNASKLSDCNINKIRNWINRGALNN